MSRILNADQVSPAHPVVVIEPGVTQGQLHDFLAESCPGLMLNPTGSARATSVLGNALDRGVGHFGPRALDIFGLEVVLGTGEVLQTGFRRLGPASPLAHIHPFGLGPMTDGLFVQGNLGIVTSACFKLMPRPERQVGLRLALRDESHLAEFLDALASLRREGVLTAVTHIGNRDRLRATVTTGIQHYLRDACGLQCAADDPEVVRALGVSGPFEWTAMTAVQGSSRRVAATLHDVKRRLRPWADVELVSASRLDTAFGLVHRLRHLSWIRPYAAALAAIRPLLGLATGVPTDAAVENLLRKYGEDDQPAESLDASRCGLLYINPALPMDGRFVAGFIGEMKTLAAEMGVQGFFVTVNVETDTSLVAVCNLEFDRTDPAATQLAHKCAQEMLRLIHARGLEVYRARVDMMSGLVARHPEYWQTLRRLKAAFDPDDIIAPGRYMPVA